MEMDSERDMFSGALSILQQLSDCLRRFRLQLFARDFRVIYEIDTVSQVEMTFLSGWLTPSAVEC